MYSCTMGESSGSSNQMTLAIKTRPNLASYLPLGCFGFSNRSMEYRSPSLEEIIEESKSHWSQVREFDYDNEVVEVSNREVFKSLQRHPTWGTFFITFGNTVGSRGELVMGEKFAEGGQAELYEVQIKWNSQKVHEHAQKLECEFALKVFKKGTSLQHLQSQWPQGMLKDHADAMNGYGLGLHPGIRCHCDVYRATLLEDGRFAFVMVKEQEDLRSMINRRMLKKSNNKGPLSKREALKAMYEVAFGMDQLHNRGIIHRDIKASNVLLSKQMISYIADFECSVGVVGTGFWRAPEILKACEHGNVSEKADLFTKAVDIYSYGMTCYEILTGKLPFEGHPHNHYNLVLQGQRPELPNYVDGWIQKLLNRCWQLDPIARPSFQEILRILLINSKICRKVDLRIQKIAKAIRIRIASDKSSKIIEM